MFKEFKAPPNPALVRLSRKGVPLGLIEGRFRDVTYDHMWRAQAMAELGNMIPSKIYGMYIYIYRYILLNKTLNLSLWGDFRHDHSGGIIFAWTKI